MPEGPGLELLIRRKSYDGDTTGFFIKIIDSGTIFLSIRPTRIEGAALEEKAVEEATGKVFILRDPVHDRYMRLSEREHFLWRNMDGAHTMQDLAAEYFFAFGSFDFDEIRRFLNKARRLGLVQVQEAAHLRQRTAPEAGRWRRWWARYRVFDRRLENVDDRFRAVYRRVWPLYSRWAFPLYTGLLGYGLGLGLLGWVELGALHAQPPVWAWLATAALILPACIGLHELSHGLATVACGRKVKALGVSTLDRFLPGIYVDVTDLWGADRWARMAVSLAGPMTNLVIAAAASAVQWNITWTPLQGVLAAVAQVNLLLALLTAWPFLGYSCDGYHALTDLARVAALRTRALNMLSAWFRRASWAERWPRPIAALLLVYLIGTGLTLGGLLGLVVWGVAAALG